MEAVKEATSDATKSTRVHRCLSFCANFITISISFVVFRIFYEFQIPTNILVSLKALLMAVFVVNGVLR